MASVRTSTLVSTVHTSGVNIESVVIIVSSCCVIMSFVVGAFAKVVAKAITGAIDKFRLDVIAKLETRITILETWMMKGRR